MRLPNIAKLELGKLKPENLHVAMHGDSRFATVGNSQAFSVKESDMVIKRKIRKKCECGCGEYVLHPKYSRFCAGHHMTGIIGPDNPNFGSKRTPEARRNISEAKKKYVFTGEHRNNIAEARKGSKATKEACLNMSKAAKGQRKGAKCHFWRGGVSLKRGYDPIFYDKKFRASIFKRDNYTCQNFLCYGKSIKLSIHHIDHNGKNCDPENLITTCLSCNSRANGSKKYPREFWHSMYTGIVSERMKFYKKPRRK